MHRWVVTRCVSIVLATFVAGCLSHERAPETDAGHDTDAGPDARGPEDAAMPDDGSLPDGGAAECDDGDPCTLDVAVGLECTHAQAPDGSTCDDGDRCTHDDRCVAGRCRGLAGEDGPPELLSTTRPHYAGTGTAVGTHLFLYAENRTTDSHLRLVRVGRSSFTVVDETDVDELVGRIESIGEGLAVYGTRTELRIVDLRGGRIALRGAITGSITPRDVAYAGDRLYVCNQLDWLDSVIEEVDVTDLDRPRRIGTLQPQCGSVVGSSDGRVAFASVESRTFRLTPRAGGVSTAEEIPVPSTVLSAGHGHLVIARTDGITVLRESDLAEEARLSGEIWASRYTRRGLEVYARLPGDPDRQTTLTIFELRPGETPALVERSSEVYSPYSAPSGIGGVSTWVSHEDGLLGHDSVAPVFDLAATTSPPYLTRVDDPDLQWPGNAVIDGTTIHLRDARRSVRIDASDPRHLRSTGGGYHDGRDAAALDVSFATPVLLGDAYRPAAIGEVDGRPIPVPFPPFDLVVRRFDPLQHAVDLATHDLELAEVFTRRDRLRLRGSDLFLLSYAADAPASLRVRSWPVSALSSQPTAAPATDTEIALGDHRLDEVSRIHDAGALAFTVNHDDLTSDIHWVSLDANGPMAAPFVSSSWSILDVAVHGDRVLALGTHRLGGSLAQDLLVLGLERRGTELVEVGRREWSYDRYGEGRVLSFDGEMVYVQFPRGLPEAPDHSLVLGTRFDRLDAPYAIYTGFGGPLQSFVETDYGIVMAEPNVLYIARPWCSAPRP